MRTRVIQVQAISFAIFANKVFKISTPICFFFVVFFWNTEFIRGKYMVNYECLHKKYSNFPYHWILDLDHSVLTNLSKCLKYGISSNRVSYVFYSALNLLLEFVSHLNSQYRTENQEIYEPKSRASSKLIKFYIAYVKTENKRKTWKVNLRVTLK